MAQITTFPGVIRSLDEVKNVLEAFNNPASDKVVKNAFKTILSGFDIIVSSFEKDENEVTLEFPIQWIRLYLKMPMLISNSNNVLDYFSNSVPIAITYIIGLLNIAPVDDVNFYTEVLNMTFKLIDLADRNKLKKLEKSGNGEISSLWNVIDRIGNFNVQMQVLQLFILILKHLDNDFVFLEVKNLPNLKNNELIYKILELLRIPKDDHLFKKMARNILNQYNSYLNFDIGVQSFHCKSLEIGKSVKFVRPTYTDKFWFDINKNPHTLSFEGRIALKSSRIYQNVSISLKIKEMFIDNNFLNIRYTPPAELSESKLENQAFKEADIVRLSLNKTQFTRFFKMFNVPSKTVKSAVEVISARDLTPNPTITKEKYRSANMVSNFTRNANRNYKSKDTLIRINTPETPTTSSFPVIEASKKIRQMEFVSSIHKNNVSSKETKKNSIISDEYEDIDVSDAEPCQSYKSFDIKKLVKPNDSESPRASSLLKRSRQCVDLCDEYSKPSKKEKMSPKCLASKNCSLQENAFDKLKNDAPSSKALIAYKDKIVDLTNDSPHFRTETAIDASTDCEGIQRDLINLKTPGTKNYFDLPTSKSTTKKVSSAVVSCEPSQTVMPHEKQQNDCLVYHRRSDSDSISDSSVSKSYSTPKRKLYNSHRSTAKKRIFDLSQTSIVDADSDCDITEFIYIGKKNYQNMQKLKGAFSSFFQDQNSLPIFKGNSKNVPAFTNFQDIVKYNI